MSNLPGRLLNVKRKSSVVDETGQRRMGKLFFELGCSV